MRISRATLDAPLPDTDAVVVIDVLRAFTTTAVAFARGASEIVLAASLEEAAALRGRYPDAIAVGEIDGYPIAGFDFGNSPSSLLSANLHGRRLILRSTAGTQGVHRSRGAKNIIAASLCCATATARYIRRAAPHAVTLLQTGVFAGGWGDDDVACADLIEALLDGRSLDLEAIRDRVRLSRSGTHYAEAGHPVFPAEDLAIALDVDRYEFAMIVHAVDGDLVLRPHYE